MGCSIASKSKLKSRDKKHEVQAIRPSAFIIENKGRFQEVYKRGKLIGSGLHAEVHTCYLKENGVKRAVKIIRKDLLQSSTYLARIEHEKEILKLFDHPNILRLYEFFEDAKRIYIVREFCDGTDLFREISSNETYTENKAARVMHQLFSVLNYIHSSGPTPPRSSCPGATTTPATCGAAGSCSTCCSAARTPSTARPTAAWSRTSRRSP